MTYKIAALYQFAPLPHYQSLQEPLLSALKELQISGSILLAEEGINGTVAGLPLQLDKALEAITAVTGLSGFAPKFSSSTAKPFRRMKVRLKKEIVTIGPVKANPTEKVGHYVEAAQWNELISSPDVILIDTRNDYEVGIGTFKGALDPQTEQFSDFPKWVREQFKEKPNARVAMFCTGGIRCEKASSFMLNEGFENVYHLKGGILKYLEEVPASESLWEGGCFVFDERVAVGHGLAVMDFSMCHGCMNPVSAHDRASPLYEAGVCCPACAETLTPEQKASGRERQKQITLAAQRGEKHLGP